MQKLHKILQFIGKFSYFLDVLSYAYGIYIIHVLVLFVLFVSKCLQIATLYTCIQFASPVPIRNLADIPPGRVFGKSTSPFNMVFIHWTAEETISSVENSFKLRISSSISLKVFIYYMYISESFTVKLILYLTGLLFPVMVNCCVFLHGTFFYCQAVTLLAQLHILCSSIKDISVLE